jgi:hypothetical protein
MADGEIIRILRVTAFVLLVAPAGLLSSSLGSESRTRGEGGANIELGARTFYVDVETGQDCNDGQSPDRAWRSLEQVNSAELKPGDTVRFKSGSVWRGSLSRAFAILQEYA